MYRLSVVGAWRCRDKVVWVAFAQESGVRTRDKIGGEARRDAMVVLQHHPDFCLFSMLEAWSTMTRSRQHGG